MSIAIETPQGVDALTEWVRFHDTVYAGRSARWSAFVPLDLAILTGESPFARGRRTRPFSARQGGKIVARVLAVLDERYQAHWREKLGHALMFEALPATREAVRRLMDEACDWLAAQGADAARAGWGMLEFPYTVDAYEALPPPFVRHTPAYYHALLKDAGFETERGWVDYKIRVRPDLVSRWESSVEAGSSRRLRPRGVRRSGSAAPGGGLRRAMERVLRPALGLHAIHRRRGRIAVSQPRRRRGCSRPQARSSRASKAQRANLSESGAEFRSLASRERQRRRASKLCATFRAREPFGSGETSCRASLACKESGSHEHGEGRGGDERRQRAVEREIEQREERFGEEHQAVAHRVLLRARAVRSSVAQTAVPRNSPADTRPIEQIACRSCLGNAAPTSGAAVVRLHARCRASDRCTRGVPGLHGRSDQDHGAAR